MSKQCRCRKGYAGADGKCANCRTKREQKAWLNRPAKKLTLEVVNKHHGHTGVYIGRGSPLGNPFPIQGADTRAVVIEKYEVWLRQQIDRNNTAVINELDRIGQMVLQGPVKLQCFCSPQPCHGDVIKQTLLRAISKTYPEYHWSFHA